MATESSNVTAVRLVARLPARLLALSLSGLIAVLLVLAALDLPDDAGGLTTQVTDNLDQSGVTHPVTAVLLNFRAYDTWLEVGVLILALLGILAVQQSADLSDTGALTDPGPVLTWLSRLLVPVIFLTGGYLLWLGTAAPGGAFQAGAVWGAAGVLLYMSGYRSVTAMGALLFRAAVLVGFGIFLIVAAGPTFTGRQMLQYPLDLAGTLILLVETTLAFSVAIILTSLFCGSQPRRSDASP